MHTRPLLQHPALGFSLMEIIIGLVLLGLLGVAGSKMMAGSFYTTQVIGNEHLGNSSARYAMERMARDVREIQYDAINDVLSLSTMTGSQLSFTKSGLLNATTNVSYAYSQSTKLLSMTVGTTTATLARDVSSLTFTYLDATLAVTTVAKNVRFVRIALTMAPPQAQSITLLTQIKLRNV